MTLPSDLSVMSRLFTGLSQWCSQRQPCGKFVSSDYFTEDACSFFPRDLSPHISDKNLTDSLCSGLRMLLRFLLLVALCSLPLCELFTQGKVMCMIS